jgi:hypothetical protein
MQELVLIVLGMTCSGLVGAVIGSRKERRIAGLFLGGFLGPIGWVLVGIGGRAGQKRAACFGPVPRGATKYMDYGSVTHPSVQQVVCILGVLPLLAPLFMSCGVDVADAVLLVDDTECRGDIDLGSPASDPFFFSVGWSDLEPINPSQATADFLQGSSAACTLLPPSEIQDTGEIRMGVSRPAPTPAQCFVNLTVVGDRRQAGCTLTLVEADSGEP